MTEKVIVGGVGMIPFSKPGASPSYTDMGADATRRALAAKGWIAALGLAAYGDADWKLVH